MRKLLFYSLELVLLFLVLAFQIAGREPVRQTKAGQQAAASVSPEGAWKLVRTTDPARTAPQVVKIIADNSFTFAEYDQAGQRFIAAGGGVFKPVDKGFTETIEYFTSDSTQVGMQVAYTGGIKGHTWTVSKTRGGKKITETWARIDAGPADQAPLFGAWRIRERETQPGQLSVMQQGPRKTIKWLSGSRFQWAAINTQTKQFFGTGGGTYSVKDGKYTENIAFFSRDPKRVGASLSFDYEVKNGDWHHRGLSTAGNKIYEVWAREK